jgi:hypothetical protein
MQLWAKRQNSLIELHAPLRTGTTCLFVAGMARIGPETVCEDILVKSTEIVEVN